MWPGVGTTFRLLAQKGARGLSTGVGHRNAQQPQSTPFLAPCIRLEAHPLGCEACRLTVEAAIFSAATLAGLRGLALPEQGSTMGPKTPYNTTLHALLVASCSAELLRAPPRHGLVMGHNAKVRGRVELVVREAPGPRVSFILCHRYRWGFALSPSLLVYYFASLCSLKSFFRSGP